MEDWGDFFTIEDAIEDNKKGGMLIHDADNDEITIGKDE